MRVLSLHNTAKFGGFSDKIINNLPRWGRFQPNFISSCKIWLKSKHACRHERMKCDVFQFVCYRQAAGIVFTHCYFFGLLPIAAKLLTGSKNRCGEMIALTSSTIMQNLVEIEQHTSV